MEIIEDLAIVLKSFQYQERDKIVVFLTENHGKVTSLAKGGVNSKRFGGTLDFLACDKIKYVRKHNSEMVRIDEAKIHHEFKTLHQDFAKLTSASFATEFCMKLVEANAPSRELFVVMSNFLFHLDQDEHSLRSILIFLCKSYKALGYSPTLLRCVRCGKAAHDCELEGLSMYWVTEASGMECSNCCTPTVKTLELDAELLLYYQYLTTTTFKELSARTYSAKNIAQMEVELFRILSDFLFHHIPGLPAAGFKSWDLLRSTLTAVSAPSLRLPPLSL